LRRFIDQVKSGDLGMLPVVVGLLLISTVFTVLNPVFLAPANLVNLLFDAAAVGLIALGVVCVLPLGEIDLSIGSISGLASASQQAGTGDVNLNAIAAAVIGGTSLFGGRGSGWSALLGVLVIMAISNGLTLLNLSSSLRYMITGAVLAIAVIVDSLARRSRASHGRG
jgi:ABC-type xylose transport system permease subunit